jgi:hypothetical protein
MEREKQKALQRKEQMEILANKELTTDQSLSACEPRRGTAKKFYSLLSIPYRWRQQNVTAIRSDGMSSPSLLKILRGAN